MIRSPRVSGATGVGIVRFAGKPARGLRAHGSGRLYPVFEVEVDCLLLKFETAMKIVVGRHGGSPQ
jgi:hypothetical protein